MGEPRQLHQLAAAVPQFMLGLPDEGPQFALGLPALLLQPP
jgi:hypothetical protein